MKNVLEVVGVGDEGQLTSLISDETDYWSIIDSLNSEQS